ncbi:MAG: hypothetical protein Q4F72_00130 [Desulfovibrionaceae bacterium]|nr:hypothetical protein [Desulfovibrionaceae bacterium]
MEDSLGLYYLPQPALPAVRVYVRRAEDGSIEYRMWDAEHPEVWEKHQWINMEVIAMAAQLFSQERDGSWQPAKIYDSNVAEALLKQQEEAEAKARAKAEAQARRQAQMQSDK